MKKYFYFLIAACLLFSFCSKEEEKKDKGEKEPNRRERVRWCPNPLYVFSVDIKKESADYALFFKGANQIDKEAIYFFKKVNGKEVKYYPMDVDFHNGKTVRVSIVEPFDFFTRKKETFYLRNRTKSYKIDILGFYGYRKKIQYGKEYFCGYYFDLEEVYINDVETHIKKDEGPYTPSEHIDLP